jgi:hypothetical protein
MKKLLILLLPLFLVGCYMDEGDGRVILTIAEPRDGGEDMIREQISRAGSVREIVRFMNNEFALSDDLVIRIGANEGPLFNEEYGEIDIPFQFIEQVQVRYLRNHPRASRARAVEFSMDVLMHVVLHEMGHALIDLYDLPHSSREEDAVDSLAAILLIEMFEDGREVSINTARSFAIKSFDNTSSGWRNYSDEHSLDEERYRKIICLIYGSKPDSYTDLARDSGLTDRQIRACPVVFKRQKSAWRKQLKPYLRDKNLLK